MEGLEAGEATQARVRLMVGDTSLVTVALDVMGREGRNGSTAPTWCAALCSWRAAPTAR